MGSFAIASPFFVRLPRSSSAPSIFRRPDAWSQALAGGGVIQGRSSRRTAPHAAEISTSEHRSASRISGIIFAGRDASLASVQRR